ncbi:MAG: nucleoside triphosphate pyrophosphohydrolase [Deltaproteobacteria bacterium]|nr:nucleoside triphosphate pyrophosphohydrolase [Deltaproteobacteria bacterium]NIS78171.1 nucleoside triphosphate pyrophosphohydrolase [Deltaproteobacteria bacterium]
MGMCLFTDLVEIMDTLRSERGCPWDREQTLESLREYLLEESYEALDKINAQDYRGLKEELGDLLFEVIFLAKIASDMGKFTIFDVIDGIRDKMVRRHPHVFGQARADTSQEVSDNWHKIKETQENKQYDSVIGGVPKNLPALFRAYKLTKKAARVKFDWETMEQILEKMEEELGEFREALASDDRAAMETEIGDILFVSANIARFVEINPEIALLRANGRFEKRFQYMEKKLKDEAISMEDTPIEDLEKLWQEAKKK